MQTVVDWLDNVGSTVFTISAWTFVAVNIGALGMVAWKRDRAMVNRWTGRLLAADLFLLGAGLGVPLVAFGARTAVVAVAPWVLRSVPVRESPNGTHAPVNTDSTSNR